MPLIIRWDYLKLGNSYSIIILVKEELLSAQIIIYIIVPILCSCLSLLEIISFGIFTLLLRGSYLVPAKSSPVRWELLNKYKDQGSSGFFNENHELG
jgi:hypothetical protein